ncbi:putative pyrophosphatase/phosphodiesterase [Smittium culicis]|uniref:Putative pyrophosphatase/phosphodiesterase n=1 Tax=Smittium culicis TaxID=133412 RepID=A0A1R1YTR2_9FUNG|nr:putative pyrophosphatase/phosphodiesterase [Smittium culicis]
MIKSQLASSLLSILFFNSATSSPVDPYHYNSFNGGIKTRDTTTKLNSKTTILISIDGFAQFYFERNITPNISKLGQDGILSEYMSPVFPTVTFANHYSIATGLYPKNHGIIGNTFYDVSLNDTFYYTRPSGLDSKWWGGEPIWVTAEKNKVISAINMFPGSESEIKGIRPTYYSKYDGTVNQTSKIDKIISWLEMPIEKRPTFLVTYFPEVDSIGHSFGPYSKQVNDSLVQIDNTVGYLVSSLKQRDLFDKVNIIIVSDHGMSLSHVPADNIPVEDLLNKANLELTINPPKPKTNPKCKVLSPVKEKILSVQLYPHAGIYPQYEKDISSIYKKLKMVEDTSKFNVYLKKDIPERFNYRDNVRIPPIAIIPNEPYIMTFNGTIYNSDIKKRVPIGSLNKRQSSGSTASTPFGVHGYDNKEEDMRAIFIAHGASFKKMQPPANPKQIHNYPKVSMLDIYNVLAKLLDVAPAPNDGTNSLVDGIVA